MARRIKFIPENYFHIYNRGVEKREIFTNPEDFRRFLILLYLCNNTNPINLRELFSKGLAFDELFNTERKEILVDIGAYCLMPNHIHILLTPKSENGVSLFLHKLLTAYTMYFNKRRERTGRLFESTFKANLVDKEGYLEYLFAYIHLNPVKLIEPKWKENGIRNLNRVKKFLDDYQWSSYANYVNENFSNSILNKRAFPKYFNKNRDFKGFIEEWLKYKEFNFPKA